MFYLLVDSSGGEDTQVSALGSALGDQSNSDNCLKYDINCCKTCPLKGLVGDKYPVEGDPPEGPGHVRHGCDWPVAVVLRENILTLKYAQEGSTN